MPPPNRILPVIQRLTFIYKLWHEFMPHITKDARYTLGTKIDALLIETIEAVFIASFLTKEKKFPYVQRAATKLDLVKFFLQIVWEIKALDNKKYILISEPLTEASKMLGGWLRQLGSRGSPA